MELSHEILLSAGDAAQALRELFELRKAADPRVSLASVSAKAKISSRGYLSDLLSGRRRTHQKYMRSLPRALGLTGEAADYLTILLRLEQELVPHRLTALNAKKVALAKVLRIDARTLPAATAQRFFAFEIFCVLSLLGEKANLAGLRAYFGRSRGVEIEQALVQLKSWGLVEVKGGVWAPLRDFVLFGKSEDGLSHVEFLRESLRQAEARVERWFGRPEEALITSSVITVRRSAYKKALPKLRRTVRAMQAGLEATPGDMLLRFNLQVFPDKS